MLRKMVLIASALGSVAANAVTFEDYARVVSVREQYEQGSQRRVCNSAQPANSGPGVGTAIGAVAGGLLGAQVGKGNGRVAASAAGAVTGALAGNYLENNRSSGGEDCYYETTGGRLIGYAVTYEYNGRTFTNTFSTPPRGDSLPIQVNLSPVTGRY